MALPRAGAQHAPSPPCAAGPTQLCFHGHRRTTLVACVPALRAHCAAIGTLSCAMQPRLPTPFAGRTVCHASPELVTTVQHYACVMPCPFVRQFGPCCYGFTAWRGDHAAHRRSKCDASLRAVRGFARDWKRTLARPSERRRSTLPRPPTRLWDRWRLARGIHALRQCPGCHEL